MDGQQTKSTFFVVPASTTFLHRDTLKFGTGPSSNQLNNFSSLNITTYDINNLPILGVNQNNLVYAPNNLLLTSVRRPLRRKKTKHGILYRQQPHYINPPNLAQAPNEPNAGHLFVMSTDEKFLEPMINTLRSGNQHKMVIDLSRFKVYQAVPDNSF